MKTFRQRPLRRTYRQYPDQNTTGEEHDGQSGRGTLTARPSSAYASTASEQGHTMDMAYHRPDPFSRRHLNQARRDRFVK